MENLLFFNFARIGHYSFFNTKKSSTYSPFKKYPIFSNHPSVFLLVFCFCIFSFTNDISAQNNYVKVALIDSDIESKDVLKNSLKDFIIYDISANDEIHNLISTLGEKTRGEKIDELVIFSHGKEGEFKLGKSTVTKATLESTASNSTFFYFFSLLDPSAKIFSFSCNSGKGTAGAGLIEAIGKFTTADIYLSNNNTGKGGDWELEISNAKEKTIPSIDLKYLRTNYQHKLQTLVEPGYTLTTKASLPTQLAGIAIDHTTGDIYIANRSTASTLYKVTSSGTVSTLNTNWSSGGTFYPFIATDVEYANGFFYSQLNSNTLRVVNTTTGAIHASLTGAVSQDESGAVIIGNYIYTTDGTTSNNRLYKRDLTTNVVTNTGITLPTANYETLESGNNPDELIYSGNGGYRRINLSTNTISGVIANGAIRAHFALSADGLFAFDYNGGTINRINLTTGAISPFITGLSNNINNDLEFGPSTSGGGYSLYIGLNTNILEVSGPFPLPLNPLGCTTPIGCIDDLIGDVEDLSLSDSSEDVLTRILIIAKDRLNKDYDTGAINLMNRFKLLVDIHVMGASATALKDAADHIIGLI